MSIRLSEKSLTGLTAVEKPAYLRGHVKKGIVHLGIGGFHRAHQAVYTDDLLATGDNRWGIIGVSLRSSAVSARLTPQDCLYTVCTREGQDNSLRIVGAVQGVLVLPQPNQLSAFVELIADKATQVVTLTITEKGYCLNARGQLDVAHPDVLHDLNDLGTPRTAAGALALALNQRRIQGSGPLTILSCDNLAGNGKATKTVVGAMTQAQNPETSHWLEDNVSFPTSMVDRIVPQTKAEDFLEFEALAGYTDAALVVSEPFSQWVIEDDFAGHRPAWDSVGAQFVGDVTAFEQAKLRLLNASHSALAYLGLLASYNHVHQALADPHLSAFVCLLMDEEIAPAVQCPVGMNLALYKSTILARFANSAVPYRTGQVAADGSQKLQQRILPTIEEGQRSKTATPGLYLVIAAWLRCLEGQADGGEPIAFSDPSAQPILDLLRKYPATSDAVNAIARETTQFGVLAQSRVFLDGVIDALGDIRQRGCLAAVESVIKSSY